MKFKSNKAPIIYTQNNSVALIRGGKKYFDLLLQLITNAKHSIHIQTYIFSNDETGKKVTNALQIAVSRGVKVNLLVDGYASQDLSNAFTTQLKKSGINFRFFEPIFRNNHFYFGRRLHHKVVVIDANSALVGGLNIADHYNDLPGKPSWLDFALFVEGDVAQQLCVLCWKTWNGFALNTDTKKCEKVVKNFKIPLPNQVAVKMIRNDWVLRKNEISESYLNMFASSNKEITILCSYFFPGTKIRRQMAKAVQRGVTIKVVVAGLSDVMIAKYAERWLYDWLLRKGIEIYEYQKNILHAKVAVCDDHWMTIGSYNINDISAYASIELNLELTDANFCKEVRQTMEEIITNNCEKITSKKIKKATTIFKKIAHWSAYKCMRIVFYLFTFYFKQQN